MMDPTQVPNASTCTNRKTLFILCSPSPCIVVSRPHHLTAYHGSATPKLFEHTCPFRFSHRLTIGGRTGWWGEWWATKDLNLGPLPCEGSALTTELVAHAVQNFRGCGDFPEKLPKAAAVVGATCRA